MSDRIKIHRTLAAHFESRSDAELVGMLDGTTRAGWGTSRTIEVDGHMVFVKTLPVTQLELDDLSSTANMFDLPVEYQYGVGSAGFGAARELAAHLKTTRWVADGRNEHFPLLHHHRLLPLPQQTRLRDPAQLDRYVEYWDGNAAIRRFIEARQASQHAIALFLEHVPHVLMDWLPQHQQAIDWVIEQARSVTDFLRAENVAHFDANPSNIVTDGHRIYFADFGLFLDDAFDLTDAERAFLSGHRYFDIGEFLASLEWPVPGRTFEPSPDYRAALAPYRAIIDEMTAVFDRLTTGPKIEAQYDDRHIAALLDGTR